MGWKIVEVENANCLKLFLENLVIITAENKITLSLKDIDVLLINNYKLTMTVQLINALSDNNIVTIVCNNKYLPQSLIVPVTGNWNTLKVVSKQLEWRSIYKGNVWKEVIEQKIFNQAEFVKKFLKKDDFAKDIFKLREEVTFYDNTNREGHASKLYWHALFGKDWKRHDEDYTNLLLDYGYTILRAYFTRSIIKKGLDPRISLFHKSYHNYFALTSDLMEPFRVIIDKEVYTIVNKPERSSFYDDKTRMIQCFNQKILVDNKKQWISNAIDLYIDSLIKESGLAIITLDYSESDESDDEEDESI